MNKDDIQDTSGISGSGIMEEKRYVIYLTGERFYEYARLQEHFTSMENFRKKPALDMHCTMLMFYSYTDEDFLKRRFEHISRQFSPILMSIKGLDMFDGQSIVMLLEKDPMLKKMHYECIDGFLKYQSPGHPRKYIGPDYTPHLTVVHMTDKNVPLEKMLIGFNDRPKLLDRAVFAKRYGEVWTKLSERKLTSG